MKQNIITLTLLAITMMVGGDLIAQTDCDPTGDGNPDGLNVGSGEGTEMASGDLAWDFLLNTTCENQGEGGPSTLKDYDPADLCNNSSDIIPLFGNSLVRVAIIDSGVFPTGPDNFNNARLISYTVSDDGVVTSGVAHPHPHGTYSAGVISGLLNYTRRIRYGKHEFYDYQVLDEELQTSLAAVVAAIDHAVANEVNVISLSIGFLPHDCDNVDWEDPASPLYASLQHARDAGVVVVTSAGNDGNDLSVSPQYPAAYTDLDNLITVGALACEAEARAPFSNYGQEIVDVFTTGAYVQVYYNGCFHTINGTSFATSIVAGKAAIHFTKYKYTEEVLCMLRTQTKPFVGTQHAIHGIVAVTSEREICAEGEERTGQRGKSLTKKEAIQVTTSPNPFHDQLQVNLDLAEGTATVTLIDGRGRKLLTREVTRRKFNLDLEHLPAGVYWLNVRNGEDSQTRTIIKK